MLSEQETKQIKEQLLKQTENFPEEQREAARQQIEAMSAQQLEEFLEKNKLAKKSPECIFCSIIKSETPSHQIDENKNAIAILEINPISKAHSLVIPKKHEPIEKLPSSILSLAKKIAKKIKSKFKAEEIKIETSTMMGHGIINIIPVYKDKKLERKKASEQELREIQAKLLSKKLTRKQKPKTIKELPKAPRRTP